MYESKGILHLHLVSKGLSMQNWGENTNAVSNFNILEKAITPYPPIEVPYPTLYLYAQEKFCIASNIFSGIDWNQSSFEILKLTTSNPFLTSKSPPSLLPSKCRFMDPVKTNASFF